MWLKIGKFIWMNLVIGVIWVFILSLTIDQKPLFNHAQDVLVKNAFVHMLDTELTGIWASISRSTEITLNQMKKKKDQASTEKVVDQL